MASFDLAIIGGGPGGYTAAIRAAQLGMQVALIEKEPVLGGTCLRIGCIPSKAMLDSSELYAHVVREGADHGLEATIKLNIGQMIARKQGVVDALTQGIAGLMKKNKITVYQGLGSLQGKGKVKVTGAKEEVIEATHILLATGSVPVSLPAVPFDGKTILDSTDALSLPKVPKSMVVIGGGAIGLELGSVWSRLGSEVTVIEFMDRIAPFADEEISKNLLRILKKQGLAFMLSSKVTAVKVSRAGATLTVETSKGTEEVKVEKVLVAVGRKPYTDGLGLETVGIKPDDKGRVVVDKHFRAAEGVYAIGDIIAGPMLAHKAEEDGLVCAEQLAGQRSEVHYDRVPNVVYTHPELAAVGKTEQELKKAGVAYNKGTFPFLANGRAKAAGMTDGLAKVLSDASTDEVLGVHILGPRASDLIAEAVMVMEFRGSAEDIARTCHAHPTFAEATKQAALDALGRVIER